ncbi:MAG: hypothetical protein K6G88_11025 [Lachnospiraceae bacterium]|nr:hypothetical protein [Lachnospiraceae bacterium]
MMKKTSILVFLIMTIMSVFVGIAQPTTVHAGGWIDHNDGIYNQAEQDSKEKEKEYKYTDEFGKKDDKDNKPGMLEKLLGEFFFGVANKFNKLFESFNLDIDSLVLGRVKAGFNDVNLLAFELSPGNPFGLVGSIVFTTLRSAAFLIVATYVLFVFVKGAISNTANSREKIKDELVSTMLMFFVLTLAPYVLDVCIYVRDVILVFLKDSLSEAAGSSGLEIYDCFSASYEASGHGIIPAALCLGTAVLTICFIYSYGSIALTNLLLFISLPAIVCFGAEKRKKTLGNWTSMWVANLAVPCFDYILLMVIVMIPVVSGYNLKSAIVQLVLASLILKARQIVLSILDLHTTANLRGVGGLMGVMAAGRLLGNAVGLVKSAGESFKEAHEAKKDAELEEDLANEENDVAKDLDSEDAVRDSNQTDAPEHDSMDEDADEEANLNDEDENIGDESVETDGDERNRDKMDSDEHDEFRDGDVDNSSDEEGEEKQADDSLDEKSRTDRSGAKESDDLDDGDSRDNPNDKLEDLQRANDELNEKNNRLEDGIQRDNKEIARNDANIERLEADNKRAQEQLDRLNDEGQGQSEQARKLQERIDGNNSEIGRLKGRNSALASDISARSSEKVNNLSAIRANNEQIQQIRNEAAPMQNYGRKWMNAYNEKNATPEQKRLHDIAMKRANVHNFDSPQFDGMLSHQEKAEFYRQRARNKAAEGVGKIVAGSGGMIVGGAGGMAASTFLGPEYQLMMAAGGSGLGGDLGTFVGGTVGERAFDAGQIIRDRVPGAVTVLMNNENSGFGTNNNQSSNTNANQPTRRVFEVSNGARNKDAQNSREFPALDSVPISKPESVEVFDNKEGEFMIRMKETHDRLEEMNNRANQTLQYAELDGERQNVAINGIISKYMTAVSLNDMTKEEVPTRIKEEYRRGYDDMSPESKAKIDAFIDKVTKEWESR